MVVGTCTAITKASSASAVNGTPPSTYCGAGRSGVQIVLGKEVINEPKSRYATDRRALKTAVLTILISVPKQFALECSMQSLFGGRINREWSRRPRVN
ncbi:hypothetical protein QTP88_003771 [Uroleucon formosanum]